MYTISCAVIPAFVLMAEKISSSISVDRISPYFSTSFLSKKNPPAGTFFDGKTFEQISNFINKQLWRVCGYDDSEEFFAEEDEPGGNHNGIVRADGFSGDLIQAVSRRRSLFVRQSRRLFDGISSRSRRLRQPHEI